MGLRVVGLPDTRYDIPMGSRNYAYNPTAPYVRWYHELMVKKSCEGSLEHLGSNSTNNANAPGK